MTAAPYPTDNRAYRFPVSIKGVLLLEGRVPLLKNERDEWELPGGKLEPGETPPSCCEREFDEELGVRVEVGEVIDSWVYTIAPDTHVLIVTYACRLTDASDLRLSHEHKELALVPVGDLHLFNMPQGYRASILAFAARQSRS